MSIFRKAIPIDNDLKNLDGATLVNDFLVIHYDEFAARNELANEVSWLLSAKKMDFGSFDLEIEKLELLSPRNNPKYMPCVERVIEKCRTSNGKYRVYGYQKVSGVSFLTREQIIQEVFSNSFRISIWKKNLKED